MVGVEALDIDGAASRALPTGRVIVWKKQRNKPLRRATLRRVGDLIASYYGVFFLEQQKTNISNARC